MTAPAITMKGLKVAEFASEETTCFQATVYVDGKRFCIASNEGHGGPDRFDALTRGREHADAIDEKIHEIGLAHNPLAKRLHGETRDKDGERRTHINTADGKLVDRDDIDVTDWIMRTDDVTTLCVFEHVVGEALTLALYLKYMKRAMSGRVLMVEGGECFRTSKCPKAHMAEFLVKVKKDNPKATILNGLPELEALDLFRAAQ